MQSELINKKSLTISIIVRLFVAFKFDFTNQIDIEALSLPGFWKKGIRLLTVP